MRQLYFIVKNTLERRVIKKFREHIVVMIAAKLIIISQFDVEHLHVLLKRIIDIEKMSALKKTR